MPNTTPTLALESIDADALLFVSGGCGGGCRRRRGCAPIIINNNNCCAPSCGTPAGPPLPTAPGTPVATAPSDPSVPSTVVTTNVSINGQPIGGQPTATA
ncbi:MAG TPA: hypothetical protein VIX73_33875 [Kofleriaceae bacterium]|jgi:hypothetical protein